MQTKTQYILCHYYIENNEYSQYKRIAQKKFSYE